MSVRFESFAKLTSSPSSGTEDGDVWWNSAASQVRASDGDSGVDLQVGPQGQFPFVRSGQWVVVPPYGSSSTVNIQNSRLFAIPLWSGQATSLVGVAVQITLAITGGNIRMGLYASDGEIPTALVQDFGTVPASLQGVQQITGFSEPLRPVLHFLAVARQGGVLNLGLTTQNTNSPFVFSPSPSLTENLTAYYRDGVGGALPVSFGAIAGAIQGPSIAAMFT